MNFTEIEGNLKHSSYNTIYIYGLINTYIRESRIRFYL